jgi:hypothetical protein
MPRSNTRVSRVSLSFRDFDTLATFAAIGHYLYVSDRVILGDGINSITLHVEVPYGCTQTAYHEIIMRRAFKAAYRCGGVHKLHSINFDPYGEHGDDDAGGISKERAEEIRNNVIDTKGAD